MLSSSVKTSILMIWVIYTIIATFYIIQNPPDFLSSWSPFGSTEFGGRDTLLSIKPPNFKAKTYPNLVLRHTEWKTNTIYDTIRVPVDLARSKYTVSPQDPIRITSQQVRYLTYNPREMAYNTGIYSLYDVAQYSIWGSIGYYSELDLKSSPYLGFSALITYKRYIVDTNMNWAPVYNRFNFKIGLGYRLL